MNFAKKNIKIYLGGIGHTVFIGKTRLSERIFYLIFSVLTNAVAAAAAAAATVVLLPVLLSLLPPPMIPPLSEIHRSTGGLFF